MAGKQSSCRKLFEQAVEELSLYWNCKLENPDGKVIFLLYAGHLLGNAEKVFLGACDAMMVHPPTKEVQEFDIGCLAILGRLFKLHYHVLIYGRRTELWLIRDADRAKQDFVRLHQMTKQGEVDSPYWHALRGRMTGVAPDMIDLKYHERYEEADRPYAIEDH